MVKHKLAYKRKWGVCFGSCATSEHCRCQHCRCYLLLLPVCLWGVSIGSCWQSNLPNKVWPWMVCGYGLENYHLYPWRSPVWLACWQASADPGGKQALLKQFVLLGSLLLWLVLCCLCGLSGWLWNWHIFMTLSHHTHTLSLSLSFSNAYA